MEAGQRVKLNRRKQYAEFLAEGGDPKDCWREHRWLAEGFNPLPDGATGTVQQHPSPRVDMWIVVFDNYTTRPDFHCGVSKHKEWPQYLELI